jgi:hypothetical protein
MKRPISIILFVLIFGAKVVLCEEIETEGSGAILG